MTTDQASVYFIGEFVGFWGGYLFFRKGHYMISVTDAAVQKIKTLITENEKELDGLRMAVKGGGCSGFQYDLEFADRGDELDHVFETKGVKIFIDMKSSLYLNGVTLDYQDGLMGSGFKIENPNARTTCGCGESFSA